MDDEFFEVDLLGKLRIDEIFYFYEEPQLFTCTSLFGQIYLVMLTDIDEREWIAIPMSSSRLALLKSNKFTVRNAITECEDEFVWKVKEINGNVYKQAEQIYLSNIDDDDLPDDDLYLDYDNDELMPILDEDIIKKSAEEKRDIIDLSLMPLDKHIRELEFQTLGEVLVNVQQVIYSIALEKDFNGNKISNLIKEDNNLSAVGTYAASFGIRAKSNKLCNFYNETPLTKNIEKFSKLLEFKNNKQELKNLLKDMNPRVLLRYKKLMECLLKQKLTFNIELASPNKHYFKTEFTEKDIENNLSYLSEDIDNIIINEELLGKLVGINVNKKRFAFETFDDEIITGVISEELTHNITFKVPVNAKIICEKETILSEFTDEEKYKYKLIKIDMLNDEG